MNNKQKYNIGDVVYYYYIDWDESNTYINKKVIITEKKYHYSPITDDSSWGYSLFIFEDKKVIKNVLPEMLHKEFNTSS
jgi:hypothetical protein